MNSFRLCPVFCISFLLFFPPSLICQQNNPLGDPSFCVGSFPFEQHNAGGSSQRSGTSFGSGPRTPAQTVFSYGAALFALGSWAKSALSYLLKDYKGRRYGAPTGSRFSYDTDLQYVQKMSAFEIKKLHTTFKEESDPINLSACAAGESQISRQLHDAWEYCGFSDFDLEAQEALWKRFEKHEQNEQKREEQRRKRAEQKRKQQEHEQRITPQRPVQTFFQERSTDLEAYKEQLALHHAQRIQKRKQAIEQALENRFKISYQTYSLSASAHKLLRQHNINIARFQTCCGNAIQQQTHQEFVDVLNDGATEIDRMSEALFGTLGQLSSVGVRANNVGHYLFAHSMADLCYNLYGFACAAPSNYEYSTWTGNIEELEEAARQTVAALGKKWCAVGDWISQFGTSVQDKAFGRPARLIAQCADAIKNDPDTAYEKVEHVILEAARCVVQALSLCASMDDSPFADRTVNDLEAFQQEWMEPLADNVASAAHVFRELPRTEKASEVIALALQVCTVVKGAQIIVGLATEAKLLFLGMSAQFDQLPKLVDPIEQMTNINIGPGGSVTLSVAMPIEVVQEGLAEVGEIATVVVGANAGVLLQAAEVAAPVAAAAQGGPPRRTPKKKTKTAREKAKKTRKRTIKPPQEIVHEYRQLAGTKVQWKGSYDGKDVAGIDLPEKIKFTKKSLDHVFSGKVEVSPDNAPLKISGYHSDLNGKAFDQSGMNMKMVKRAGTGALKTEIRLCGKRTWKTLFPENWTPKNVLNAVKNAMQNVYRVESFDNGRIRYLGRTDCNMTIEVITESSGEVVTFYPKLLSGAR